VIFGRLHFPDAITFGPYAQQGLQLKFLAVASGPQLARFYVIYGFATGRVSGACLFRSEAGSRGEHRDACGCHISAMDVHAITIRSQRILYIGVLLDGVADRLGPASRSGSRLQFRAASLSTFPDRTAGGISCAWPRSFVRGRQMSPLAFLVPHTCLDVSGRSRG